MKNYNKNRFQKLAGLIKENITSKEDFDLFNKMSEELGDWIDTYLEDGLSQRAALLSGHKKIEEKYPNQYDAFNKWLDKGSSPHG